MLYSEQVDKLSKQVLQLRRELQLTRGTAIAYSADYYYEDGEGEEGEEGDDGIRVDAYPAGGRVGGPEKAGQYV